MRSNLSDAAYSTIIGIVARIPVEAARRLFLEGVQAALPAKGAINEEQLTDAVNATLKSFEPGTWQGDAQGTYPTDTSTLTLKEAADLYLRMIREVGAWSWPPHRPLTDEERKAKAAQEAERVAKLDALGIKTGSDRYLFESICEGDLEMFKRRKAEDDAHRAFMSGGAIPTEMWEEAAQAASAGAALGEIAFDPTQPPPAKVVEVVPEPQAETEEDMPTQADDPSPFFSDWDAEGKDNRGRDEQSGEDDMSEMAKAARMAKRLKRNRSIGRFGKPPPKVFF